MIEHLFHNDHGEWTFLTLLAGSVGVTWAWMTGRLRKACVWWSEFWTDLLGASPATSDDVKQAFDRYVVITKRYEANMHRSQRGTTFLLLVTKYAGQQDDEHCVSIVRAVGKMVAAKETTLPFYKEINPLFQAALGGGTDEVRKVAIEAMAGLLAGQPLTPDSDVAISEATLETEKES